MNNRLDFLRERYTALAAEVGAPASLAEFHETPTDSGAPHIECEGLAFCYVTTERGEELERRRTWDPDQVLYWLLHNLTFQMACDHGMKHRRPGKDFRRQLFARQLELLGMLKAEWRATCETELNAILQKHPFRDE
jgi:hypothetical protein